MFNASSHGNGNENINLNANANAKINDEESILINIIAIMIGYVVIVNIITQIIFSTLYAIFNIIAYTIYYSVKIPLKFIYFTIKCTYNTMTDFIGIIFEQLEKFIKTIFCMNEPYHDHGESSGDNANADVDADEDADEREIVAESEFDNSNDSKNDHEEIKPLRNENTRNIVIIENNTHTHYHKYNGICDEVFLAYYAKNKDVYKHLYPDMSYKDIKNSLYRRWKTGMAT